MTTASGRSFGIADGLILVAATAAGLAGSRAVAPGITLETIASVLSEPADDGWSIRRIAGISVELGSVFVVPCLGAWTVAVLAMRLRSPRPAWRRLVRQPGVMACLVASAVIGLCGAWCIAVGVSTELRDPHRMSRLLGGVIFASLQAGDAVLWCWLTMAVTRRWRAEPTWLDRLGRLIGTLWIGLAVISAYATGVFWLFD